MTEDGGIEQSVGLCPHGNFPNACESCIATQKQGILDFFKEHPNAEFDEEQIETLLDVIRILEQKIEITLSEHNQTVNQKRLLGMIPPKNCTVC